MDEDEVQCVVVPDEDEHEVPPNLVDSDSEDEDARVTWRRERARINCWSWEDEGVENSEAQRPAAANGAPSRATDG